MDKTSRQHHTLARRVVDIRRRIASICVCCGRVQEEAGKDSAPFYSVNSDTDSLSQRQLTNIQSAVCCSCPWRQYADRGLECLHTQYEHFPDSNLGSTEDVTQSQDNPSVSTTEAEERLKANDLKGKDRTSSVTETKSTITEESQAKKSVKLEQATVTSDETQNVPEKATVGGCSEDQTLGNTFSCDKCLPPGESTNADIPKNGNTLANLHVSKPGLDHTRSDLLSGQQGYEQVKAGIKDKTDSLDTGQRNVSITQGNSDPSASVKGKDTETFQEQPCGIEDRENIEKADKVTEFPDQNSVQSIKQPTELNNQPPKSILNKTIIYEKLRNDCQSSDKAFSNARRVRRETYMLAKLSKCRGKKKKRVTFSDSPGGGNVIESLSQTSQTDDFVAHRYLAISSLLGRSSFPACSQCAIGVSPQTKLAKYFRPNPVPEAPDSVTMLEMARRHVIHENYVRSSGIKLRYSKGMCSLRNPSAVPLPTEILPPPDLKVEYAVNMEWYRIYPHEWSVMQNITRNKSGPVDLAMLGEYNKEIALKTLNASTSKRESDLIIECQGPFVAQLCACLLQGDTRYLCMTYYDRRDLGKWMKRDRKRKYFLPDVSVWICGYILAAVEFLHDKEILHLDIKPGNILIHYNGYPVVGDFGSSRRIPELEEETPHFAFTLAYASPEVMAGVKPDRLADLWPLAVIFYELLAAEPPFPRTNNIAVQLQQALETTPDVSMCSPAARDFITSQLKRQKRERLGFVNGARDLMQHRVFGCVDWAEIKYAHRHSRSRLEAVFSKIERDEREEKVKPVPVSKSPFILYIKKRKI